MCHSRQPDSVLNVDAADQPKVDAAKDDMIKTDDLDVLDNDDDNDDNQN